ncbi:MAG TPA: methionyl-tRNA formyltransferase [Bacteroidetes bacterium]|nr:methionyl-tRNA formyltransferase [Bacteroidota bacterium]
MGTPDFAVASLEAILRAEYQVVAVITAPDKPAGRGLKLQESAVKTFALAHSIPILQPVNLKAPEFIDELKSYQADIQVVIAFRMLPEVVWNMPPLGTFNLHASLLPAYRGAAPINRAIMNGEKETGVSTFFLQHEIDTGPIVFSERTAIEEHETAGELHDRLMLLGASLVIKTLDAVISGTCPQNPQVISGPLPTAPKLFKEDCRLDPEWSIHKIYNHIRGLSPYPGAFTFFKEKQLKIFAAEKHPSLAGKNAGEWVIENNKDLYWQCSDGSVRITDLQLEGKRRMKTEELLRGMHL